MGGGMLTIVLLVVIAYLSAGTFIFIALEADLEINRQTDLMQKMHWFLGNHTCITKEDLRSMFEDINNDLQTARYVLYHNSTSNVMWDQIGAASFVFTVVTTIGYGHITPRTDYGRIVCIVYAIIGIPLILVYLKGIGEKLCTLSERFLDCQFHFGNVYRCQPHRRLNTFILGLLSEDTYRRPYRINLNLNVKTGILGVVILFVLPTAMFSYFEEWTLLESFYYWFITLTTIGFGDLVAENPLARHSVDGKIPTAPKVFWGCCKLTLTFVGLSVISMIITSITRYYLTSTTVAKEKASHKIKVLAHRCIRWKSKTPVSPDLTPSPIDNPSETVFTVPQINFKSGDSLPDSFRGTPQLVHFSASSDDTVSVYAKS